MPGIIPQHVGVWLPDIGKSSGVNSFFFFLIFTEVWFLYNVVLVSAVQQSESVVHTHIPPPTPLLKDVLPI